MTTRAALLAAFLCATVVSAGAAELSVSPNDFGIDPVMPAPLPPPPGLVQQQVRQPAAEPTGSFLTVGPAATVPFATFAPVTAAAPVATVPFVTSVPGTDPLQAAAPDLYASLTATVTATTGDPSIPVVVRPATTAQATDASGVPVNLAGIAAQGSPVVDWNAARAGTPYPVENPGQPGVMTYVVPIQVPVYVQPGQTAAVVPAPVAPAAQTALPGQPFVQTGQVVDPFANIVAITPGATPTVPSATAAIAGNGGVYYYGQNPVSIASALGYDTATGTEFLDFNAMPGSAINLVTPAQIRHALMRQTPLVILDVRSDFVRDIEGHVVGDVNVPFQPAGTFAARVAQAIPEKTLPVVVYCQDGVWASHAADALLSMGYKTFLMGAYRLWL